MTKSAAKIIREYGPFEGVEQVAGVTFDGANVWFASGDRLNALDPETGKPMRSIAVPAHAGTAFDGTHLYQIAEKRIQKIDPKTGRVLASIPSPGDGKDSGMAWAEGTLWVGQYTDRKIHQIDPETGRILRTIESDRFVTGVSWVEGELWHATWEADESEIRVMKTLLRGSRPLYGATSAFDSIASTANLPENVKDNLLGLLHRLVRQGSAYVDRKGGYVIDDQALIESETRLEALLKRKRARAALMGLTHDDARLMLEPQDGAPRPRRGLGALERYLSPRFLNQTAAAEDGEQGA